MRDSNELHDLARSRHTRAAQEAASKQRLSGGSAVPPPFSFDREHGKVIVAEEYVAAFAARVVPLLQSEFAGRLARVPTISVFRERLVNPHTGGGVGGYYRFDLNDVGLSANELKDFGANSQAVEKAQEGVQRILLHEFFHALPTPLTGLQAVDRSLQRPEFSVLKEGVNELLTLEFWRKHGFPFVYSRSKTLERPATPLQWRLTPAYDHLGYPSLAHALMDLVGKEKLTRAFLEDDFAGVFSEVDALFSRGVPAASKRVFVQVLKNAGVIPAEVHEELVGGRFRSHVTPASLFRLGTGEGVESRVRVLYFKLQALRLLTEKTPEDALRKLRESVAAQEAHNVQWENRDAFYCALQNAIARRAR